MDHRLWVLTGLTFKFRAWLRNLSLTLPIVSGSLKYYCLSHQWAGVMVHFSLRNLASKQTEKKRTTTNNTGTKWLQPSKNYNRRGGDQRNCETGIHCWINKIKKIKLFHLGLFVFSSSNSCLLFSARLSFTRYFVVKCLSLCPTVRDTCMFWWVRYHDF